MTRTCRVCKIEKPLEEFTKHKKMKFGYDYICLKCNRIHSSKYNKDNPEKYKLKCKRWYRKNTKKVTEERKRKYKEIIKFKEKCKEEKSCIKCGYNEIPQILQFHHRDEKEKNFTIAESASLGISLENLQKEVNKCDLLCPNCHYKLHFLKWKEDKEKNKPLY